MTKQALDALTRLAVRFGCDKFGPHLYTSIYDSIFGYLREEPVRLLEIGVGGYGAAKAGGRSLRMWAEYFPYGKIVGLDIARKDFEIAPNVSIVQGSQTDVGVLERILAEHGPFDIVIDDGSHIVEDVLGSFEFIYPRLPSGSFYVAEDTQTAFAGSLGGNPSGHGTIFTLAHSLSLAMHQLDGYAAAADKETIRKFAAITKEISFFRNLIVFHRGDNTYPSNLAMDLNDIQVQQVFETIEAEMRRNPSRYAGLARIDMAIWAGETQKAAQLAIEAAATHPHDPFLRAELILMMEWAGRSDIVDALRRQV